MSMVNLNKGLMLFQDARVNYCWRSVCLGCQLCQGFFADSLPRARAEIGAIAVLRIDGDMYESYMDILYNLYEFVPVGGYSKFSNKRDP